VKKIGEYVARGSIFTTETGLTDGDEVRVNLFDGDYKTGYKLVEFHCVGGDAAATDVSGRVTTQAGLASDVENFWNFGDNRQIGWSAANGATDILAYETFNLVDPENLVIEEVYVGIRTPHGTTSRINYFMRFEKYELPPFRGPLARVENMSQG